MGSGNRSPIQRWRMTVATIIRGVVPKHTAKWLQGSLGCTETTAWRIIETGKVPHRMRPTLFIKLREAMALNEARMRELRAQLKDLDYVETHPNTSRISSAKAMGQGAPVASRQDQWKQDDLLRG